MDVRPPRRFYARGAELALALAAPARGLWRGLLPVSFVLLLASIYQRQTSLVERFRFDDSYITLRYAQQLSEHGILSFNPDERIDGYTSPGWTLLLALVDGLGLDAAESMLALGRVAGFLSVIVACALARALGASKLFACVIPAAGVLYTPGFIVWSIPGMEMPFAALIYAFLLLQMVAPTARAGSERERLYRGSMRASLLFLAALARPEGALLALALFAAELWLLSEELPRPVRLRGSASAPLLVVALLLLALLIWRWTFYGYALPNTFYAKSPTPLLIERGIADARRFVSQRGIALAPLSALLLCFSDLPRRTRAILAVFAFWFVCVLTVYARSGGDFPGFHRFYQPLVPAAFAVLACALTKLTALVRARLLISLARGTAHFDTPFGRALVGPLVVALCALYLVDFQNTVLREAFVKNSGMIASQTAQVASWARAGRALRSASARGVCPRPMRVATRAAGAVPHFSRAERVYDTLALNNPHVAHHNRAVRDVPAHQKEATDAQVLAWQPNIIVGHPKLVSQDFSGRVSSWLDNAGFRRAGFGYRCIPTELLGEFFCFWQREAALSQR